MTSYLAYLTGESRSLLDAAERTADPNEAMEILRRLPLDDYGLVLLDDLPDHPFLRGVLPTMASDETQKKWTGSSGVTLLRQSLSFVRGLNYNLARWRGRSLDGASVVDYGCGWGRLLRLLSYYSGPDLLHGVDPWQASIDECLKHGVKAQIHRSEFLPVDLPIAPTIDLAFAFSVFTHTSEKATRTALKALRSVMKPSGLLVFTVRPREFWQFKTEHASGATSEALTNDHDTKGFAFTGYGVIRDGEWLYGDASMSVAFARELLEATGWRWLALDRSLEDMYQLWIIAEPME